VNRKDLQNLAETRLKDAELLYKHRRYDGAYYLAGYVVECALKACIAKKVKRYDFPDKDLAHRVFTHDLSQLLTHAGLMPQFKLEFRNNPQFEVRWGVVKDWSARSRYETHGRYKAKGILDAVTGSQGILACIKRFW
jgi:HEPN domain-containing protein